MKLGLGQETALLGKFITLHAFYDRHLEVLLLGMLHKRLPSTVFALEEDHLEQSVVQ